MILEVKYVDKKEREYKSIYVSFPDRYCDNEDVVNRICKKVWRKMMLDAFNNEKLFGCYSAFTKDFREFLMTHFQIGSNEDWTQNFFYGIQPYEVPHTVPFITK